jgi:hypothetical protein
MSLVMGTTQQPSKSTFDNFEEAFLVKVWNSFHLARKKLDYPHLKDFLKCERELYLKQLLTPSQCEITAAYHTSNHRLAIKIGQWSTVHVCRDNRLCHSCSYDVFGKTRDTLCSSFPYVIPLEISFNHHLRQ